VIGIVVTLCVRFCCCRERCSTRKEKKRLRKNSSTWDLEGGPGDAPYLLNPYDKSFDSGTEQSQSTSSQTPESDTPSSQQEGEDDISSEGSEDDVSDEEEEKEGSKSASGSDSSNSSSQSS
jgi:hypothetical protein